MEEDRETSLIYTAWRDSEAYAVPMTSEGERYAMQRYYGFLKGWMYARFYDIHGHVYKKSHEEQPEEESTEEEPRG